MNENTVKLVQECSTNVVAFASQATAGKRNIAYDAHDLHYATNRSTLLPTLWHGLRANFILKIKNTCANVDGLMAKVMSDPAATSS